MYDESYLAKRNTICANIIYKSSVLCTRPENETIWYLDLWNNPDCERLWGYFRKQPAEQTTASKLL